MKLVSYILIGLVVSVMLLGCEKPVEPDAKPAPIKSDIVKKLDRLNETCWYIKIEKSTKWLCWARIDWEKFGTAKLTDNAVMNDNCDTMEEAVSKTVADVEHRLATEL